MTPEKKQMLHQRRIRLQTELRARKFAARDIEPFLEIWRGCKAAGVVFGEIKLVDIQPEWRPVLAELFGESPYAAFNLNAIPQSEDNPGIGALLDIYPTTNAFRYVPDLPLHPEAASPADMIDMYHLTNRKVYFYYFRYAFMVALPLAELAKLEGADFFNFWHGDVAIFPENYSWLMAYSLEEEWRFGRRRMGEK